MGRESFIAELRRMIAVTLETFIASAIRSTTITPSPA